MTKPEPINSDRETTAKSVNTEPDKTKNMERSPEATRYADDNEQGSRSVGRNLHGGGADAAGIEEAKRKPTTVELDTNTANFFADLEAIRLSPEDTSEISTREILTRVPVRKPRKGEFFRVPSGSRHVVERDHLCGPRGARRSLFRRSSDAR
jgi:hypothetical protein